MSRGPKNAEPAIPSHISTLNGTFIERREIIDTIMPLMVAKEHMLLIGPPGTAKSQIARAICGLIKSDRYFERLLTRFSTPPELFGPPSMKKMQMDIFEFVTAGRLPEAEVAFLDEIFKGNSSILNALLAILNERTFHNGATPMKVPLRILVGASNEWASSDELNALDDRFALRFLVKPIQSSAGFLDMLNLDDNVPPTLGLPEVSMKELDRMSDEARDVELLGDILLTVRDALLMKQIEVSDRRWRMCAKLLRAVARVHNHKQVYAEHLDILRHALWLKPQQQKEVNRVVTTLSSPIGPRLLDIDDAVVSIWSEFQDEVRKVSDAARHREISAKTIPKLRKMLEEVDALEKQNPHTAGRIGEVRQRIQQMMRDISREFMGIPSLTDKNHKK